MHKNIYVKRKKPQPINFNNQYLTGKIFILLRLQLAMYNFLNVIVSLKIANMRRNM
jgi:hypothetical protein